MSSYPAMGKHHTHKEREGETIPRNTSQEGQPCTRHLHSPTAFGPDATINGSYCLPQQYHCVLMARLGDFELSKERMTFRRSREMLAASQKTPLEVGGTWVAFVRRHGFSISACIVIRSAVLRRLCCVQASDEVGCSGWRKGGDCLVARGKTRFAHQRGGQEVNKPQSLSELRSRYDRLFFALYKSHITPYKSTT